MAGASAPLSADDNGKELDVDLVNQACLKKRAVEGAARVGDDAVHAEDPPQAVDRLAQIHAAVADLEVRHVVLAEELAYAAGVVLDSRTASLVSSCSEVVHLTLARLSITTSHRPG